MKNLSKHLTSTRNFLTTAAFFIIICFLVCASANKAEAQSPVYVTSGNYTPPNNWTQSTAGAMGTIQSTNIYTTKPNGTGNQYFRFYSATSGGTQYGPNGSSDLQLTDNVSSVLQVEGGAGKAYYLNIANSSSNVVMKTNGSGAPGTSTAVCFEIQGTVRTVSSVTQSPVAASVTAGSAVTVTANLSGAFATGQGVYLRYTTNSYTTSTVVQMTGSGTVYTANIPAGTNTLAANISYYVFTSGNSGPNANGSDADLFTINLNNNSGSNYSYTVISGASATIASVGAATPLTGQTSTSNNGYLGQVITITGTNLSGVSAVSFGGTTATSISSTSTTITCTLAAGASGTVSATVTAGTATFPSFTYLGYVTTANTDWTTGSTWLGGNVPPAGAATTVNNTITVSLANVTNSPATIIINSSKSITFGGAYSLTASTSITNNGAITTFAAATLTSPSIILNSGSTLTFGAANTVASSSSLMLNGGTLVTGATTGYSNSLTNINMTASSAITFVSAGNANPNQQVKFSTTTGTWTGTLTINNWQGSTGTSGTFGQLFIGTTTSTLTSTQMGQVAFGSNTGTQITGGEVVPTFSILGAGIYDSYITIGSTQYYLGESGGTPTGGTFPGTHAAFPSTTELQGATLTGSPFTVGSTLNIANAAMYVWRAGNGNSGNVCGNSTVFYTVSGGGINGSVTLNGSLNNGTPTNPTAGNSLQYYIQTASGLSSSTTNILSGLAAGNYTLQIYISAPVNLTGTGSCNTTALANGLYGTSYSGSQGALYTANFTVACAPPVITQQPTNQASCGGAAGTFSVTATGSGLTYQWYNGTTASPIASATNSSYSTSTVSSGYFVVVTASTCTTTSNTVSLTNSSYPTITGQPSPVTTCAGNPASFSVTASPETGYQWGKAGTAISGATNSSFSIGTVAGTDAANYSVTVTNSGCSTTSNNAALTVNTPPSIGTQPTAQAGCTGGSATFNVSASGTGLTYQWYNGSTATPISGQTNSSYTISPVSSGNLGNYGVVISGTCPSPLASNFVALAISNTWTGATNSDWNTGSNWCGGSVPIPTDIVVIPNVTNKPIIGGSGGPNAVCASITIASGATLTMQNSYTLTISSGGSFTNNNSTAALVPGNGSVIFAGTGSIGGSFATTFNNLSLQSGTVTLSDAITINGTLTLGSGSNSGTLALNGNNVSAAALAISGSGGTSNNIQNGNASTAATLTVTGSGTSSFGGSLTNGAAATLSLTMSGTGTLTLAGGSADTYTGATTISGGILQLGAANSIPSASNVTLSGGTLSSGATTGFSDVMGTLNLQTNNSTIALGTGAHQLNFANSSAVSWTGCPFLTVTGWTGTSGTSGTAGQVFFGSATGTLSTTQLTQTNFSGYGIAAVVLSTGELVPTNLAANVGINDSYVTIGGTNYYMGASGPIPAGFTTTAPTFSSGLGTLYAGTTANISASQISIWKSNGTIQGDVSGGKVYYAIYPNPGTPPPFSSFNVALSGFGFTSQAGNIGSYIPQVWTGSGATANIFSALSQGSYNLDVYVVAFGKNNTTSGCTENIFAGTSYTAVFAIGPSISSVVPTPAIGAQANNTGYTGQTLVITGSGFTGATAVSIGGVAATSFTVNSNTQITAVVGPAAGGNTVAITGAAGTTSTAAFTYLGYISQSTGVWSNGASWLGGVYAPANVYPVTIASPNTITLDNSSAIVSSLTINSGAIFNADNGSAQTLTISTATSATTLSNSGTFSSGTNTGSIVAFTAPLSATGTIANTVSGTVSFGNVSVGRTTGSAAVVQLNFGTAGTVTGNYYINNGGSTATNAPIYGTNSTLVYNTGNTYNITAGTVEWVGGATSGAGVPRNVQVGTSAVSNTVLSFGTVAAVYEVQGNLVVGATGGTDYGMTLSTTTTSGLNIKGNYTITNAFVTNNNRGIQFNGTTNQVITYTGGGTVFFDILILNNVSGNVQLANGTNVTITYANQTTAQLLQMLNNSQLDLNGQTFTMNGNTGAQIVVNFTGRTITSSVPGGIFAIYTNTSVVVSGSGTLNIGVTGATSSNTTLQINSGFDCGVGPLTYIYGTLQMQNNGFINNNSPFYEPNSLLDYNSGNTFGRHLEWNAASGQGYPYNVTINTGTTLDPSDFGIYINQVFDMAGNLSIYGNLFMDVTNFNMITSLNVGGNILINGSLSASGLVGGDISLQGDWTNNGTYTGHGRLVSFLGATPTETIGGTTSTLFNYMTINKGSGFVQLSNSISVSNNLTLSGGILKLNNNNIGLLTAATLGGTLNSSNMVVTNGSGQFVWSLPVISSPTTYIYPVGDATPNYTPVTLTFASNSGAGTLGVNVVNGTEANMNTPSAPAAYLKRYWTFGHNTLANYSYTGTFNYVAGDVSGLQSKIQLSSWTGSAWAPYYGSAASSNVLTETETLNQTTAALTGDFTGRTGTLAAYAVTGGTNCASEVIGVASSQDNVSYQLYVNAVSTGSPVTSTATGSAITFGTQTTAGTYTVIATDINGNTLAMTGTAVVNPNPTPSIAETDNSGTTANDSKICNLDAVTLSGIPSTGLTYSWSAGLGTAQTVVDNPSVSTTYTVTVTDANTCTGTATKAITVNTLPPVAVTPSSAVCTGFTTATLTASGATSYTWAPAANLTSTNGGVTETAQISALTFYTVTGTDANKCSAQVTVPVATVPTGGFATPVFSIICSGTTKTLTVTGAAGHDYQWQMSSDNIIWTNINGATNTTYTTASGDGTTNKFYRLMAQSNSCWNVASTTAEVDVSSPNIMVTASNITDNSLTLNWSPTGTGNYTISYSGPSSATLTSVTPAKTITGLTANGTYSITVTQTGLGCPASGTITGIATLCAMPTGVTLSSPANSQILVSWTGVVGADYRVYYRPLFSYNTYFTKDVSNASSVLLTKQGNNNLYASTTYEVYVSRLDCPTTGATGQGTSPTNVTTLPTVSCATPSIDSVRSLCPVQIEVFLHPGSSPTNTYNIYIQRITPTILAVNSYGVTGNYFTISVPYSGDQFLIAAESKCTGGGLSALYIWPGNLTIKPLCSSLSNLVLSNPTCHGFTASWNSDQCLSNSASGYEIDLRVQGTINYNSYGVPLPANGIGPNKTINFVTSGRTYQAFVRSIYNCNGYVTYGPASQVQSITTLSSGCRDEDATQPEETKPSVQQYSRDNQEIFSLYPNPNNGEFVVDLSRFSAEEEAVRIEVINMIGQTVMTHLTIISGGHMSEFINLPNGTTTGTYIVRLTAGKNVYTSKINISK